MAQFAFHDLTVWPHCSQAALEVRDEQGYVRHFSVGAEDLVGFAQLADLVKRDSGDACTLAPSQDTGLAARLATARATLLKAERDVHFADLPIPPADPQLLAEAFHRLGLPAVISDTSTARSNLGAGVSPGRRAELLAMTETGRRILEQEAGTVR